MSTPVNWNSDAGIVPPMTQKQSAIICGYIPKALLSEGEFADMQEVNQFMKERMQYLRLIKTSRKELSIRGAGICMNYFQHYLDCTHCSGARMDVCEGWKEEYA